MNKKIIGAGVFGVALVGGFMYIGQLEKKIEDAVRVQIEQTPISVEDIKYNLLSNVIHLNDVSFEHDSGKSTVVLSVDTVSVTDLNVDILTTDEEFPLVFGKLAIKDLEVDLKDTVNAAGAGIHISFDSFTLNNYAHNLAKLLKEYNTNGTTEEFFEALYKSKYDDSEAKGYKFVLKDGSTDAIIDMSVATVKVKAAGYPQIVSIDYEEIEASNDVLDLEIESFSFDDLRLPDAKALARITTDLIDLNVLANTKESQAYEDFLDTINEHLDYSTNVLFSEMSMNEMKFSLDDRSIKDIKDKEISLKKLSLNLGSGDNTSLIYTVEDFVMSPEYITLLLPRSAHVLDAFIKDNLVLNVNNKTELNNETKLLTLESFISVSPLFETSNNGTAYYKGQDFWNLFNLDSNDSLELVAYEKLQSTYTDTGFIPLGINLVASEFGLPMEVLLPAIKAQLSASSTMLKTGKESLDVVIVDFVEALVALIDKPGSLEFDAQFDTPYTLMDLLKTPPTDFEVNIDVKQGKKTVLELTPASVLNK